MIELEETGCNPDESEDHEVAGYLDYLDREKVREVYFTVIFYFASSGILLLVSLAFGWHPAVAGVIYLLTALEITFLLRESLEKHAVQSTGLVAPLLDMVVTDDRFDLQELARALGRTGDHRAVKPLLYLLKVTRDRNPPVQDRYSIIVALGVLGMNWYPWAVEALVTALEDRQVRLFAARELAILGNASGLPVTLDELVTGDSEKALAVLTTLAACNCRVRVAGPLVQLLADRGTDLPASVLTGCLEVLVDLFPAPAPDLLVPLQPLLTAVILSAASDECKLLAKELLVVLRSHGQVEENDPAGLPAPDSRVEGWLE